MTTQGSFDLFAYQATPLLCGALDDTSAPGFVYHGTPFIAPAQATGAGYVYDELGRLVQINLTNYEVINYSYDADGNRTAVSST